MTAPLAECSGDSARAAESPEAWLRALGGPRLIRVPGRDASRCRVVVTLLHGNEPSGVRALHAWLRRGIQPPVDTWLVVAAVEAALAPPGFARRVREGGRDLNRCFRAPFADPDGELAAAILDRIADLAPEALLDVHNTTGATPPYVVATHAHPWNPGLTGLFAEHCVHTGLRIGALIEATGPRCPSLVVECGPPGGPADEVARRGLEDFLSAPDLAALPQGRIESLRDLVRVRVRPGTRVAYAAEPQAGADLTLAAELDALNFCSAAAGTQLGWLPEKTPWPLLAADASGTECSRELFAVEGGCLLLAVAQVPLMITTDPQIAESDCLFYLARRAPG